MVNITERLLSSDFKDFNQLGNNKNLQFILNQDTWIQKNIVDFIVFTRKTPNVKFELKLEDVDEEFIRFIKDTFFLSGKWEDRRGKYVSYRWIFISDYKLPWWIFDEDILDYKYFEIQDNANVKVETAYLYNRDNLDSNLETLCNKFNTIFSITSLKEIEKWYNDYLGNDGKNQVYLYNFLQVRDIWPRIDFFIHYQSKYHNKQATINEVLSFLETTKDIDYYLSVNWRIVGNLELLDKYVDNFNIKDFITLSNNKYYLQELPEDFLEVFQRQVKKIERILIIFDNITLEQLIKYSKNYEDIFIQRSFHSNPRKMFNEYLWKQNNLDDYDNLSDKIWFEINRWMFQYYFDTWNYENLKEAFSLINSKSYKFWMTENSSWLKDLVVRLIEKTNWYLDENLLEIFITWKQWRNITDEENWDREMVCNWALCIEELEYVENLTWVDLRKKTFQNIFTSGFIINVLNDKEKYEKIFDKRKKEEFIKIFEYDISMEFFYENIDEILNNPGWILYWYFHLNLLFSLTENGKWINLPEDFPINLKNILEFMPENEILLTIYNNKFSRIDWTIAWTKAWFLENPKRLCYLKPEIIKSFNKYWTIVWLWILEWIDKNDDITVKECLSYFSTQMKLWGIFNDINFPIQIDNFIDYLPENEPLFTFEKDQNLKYNWTKPWTKAWFLEKPERQNYLKPENIIIFKLYSTTVWLAILEWINGDINTKKQCLLCFSENTKKCNELHENFPINFDNFMDYLPENESLFTFEKDQWFKSEWTIPWTKTWFLEKSERQEYLKPEHVTTFNKFGTIIWLWIIEWSQSAETLDNFYTHIFSQISPEKSRSSILQLWEVFNLLLKKQNYEMLDKLVDGEENIWTEFKNFIEEHSISDKWRTIITLMIAREINSSFAIFNNPDGKQQVDAISVKEMLLSVSKKLKTYKKVIEKYNNIPVKTSIGIEIEISGNVAKWYKKVTWSDYKNDIEILSEYSWIGKWLDAIHEFATKPTNNPYLLVLEIQLLQDLDFIDLNFKKEDYSKWARWMHLNVWWENWIIHNENSHFIENILLAANFWWLNAWKNISRTNNTWSHLHDREALFIEHNTGCVEYRNFSIDKAEPFERLIISTFNLHIAKQLFEKEQKNYDEWVENNIGFLPEIVKKVIKEDDQQAKVIYEFIKLQWDIIDILENHKKNFFSDEVVSSKQEMELEKLITVFISKSPFLSIIEEAWINIYYFKEIFEQGIESKEDFFNKLMNDGKQIEHMSFRQLDILFWKYDLIIKPELLKLKNLDKEIYENIWEYLNWNTEDTVRKITNWKRFDSVINWDNDYLTSLWINIWDFFKSTSPDLVNTFTKINNLFIKKDSANALSMLDTTKEPTWETISDSKHTEMMIFDKLDYWIKPRSGYNVIQWASENMLTQAIQKRVLEFNDKIKF